MAQESVQAQVKQQRLRNFGFWMAFIVVFSLLHLGGLHLFPSFYFSHCGADQMSQFKSDLAGIGIGGVV